MLSETNQDLSYNLLSKRMRPSAKNSVSNNGVKNGAIWRPQEDLLNTPLAKKMKTKVKSSSSKK